MNSDGQGGLADRAVLMGAFDLADMAPASRPVVAAAIAVGPILKMFVRGLERDERQLLEGLVRVSQRRSPRLALLSDAEAAQADVVLIGANDPAAVRWARAQPWLDSKAVIWIGASGAVPPGHTAIRRPVQWSILPSLMARALERGPDSVYASRPTPLTSGHVPLASSPAPVSGAASLAGAGAGLAVAPRLGSNPILVVDDSLAIRNHLRSLLESAGFSVKLVDSVESALKMVSQRTFDCVLMDVLMPGVDGYEGCRQIKTATRGARSLPVIMLTSKSSPFDRIRGKMAGCDAYLTKPIDPQQLGEVLAQHIQS